MAKKNDSEREFGKLSDFLCFALYSANHAMNRLNKPLLDELGLTYPQYLVLVTLWENDKQLVSDIGRSLLLESNTLTPLIKRLEAMGHVTRKRDENDERKVRVSLTVSGKKLEKKTTAFPKAVLKATGLTEKSFDKLQGEIVRLRERLIEQSKVVPKD